MKINDKTSVFEKFTIYTKDLLSLDVTTVAYSHENCSPEEAVEKVCSFFHFFQQEDRELVKVCLLGQADMSHISFQCFDKPYKEFHISFPNKKKFTL